MRTNNNAEGYHRRIMDKANGKHSLRFYQLVSFLHAEGVTVGRQVDLVREGLLERYQRRIYRENQAKIFILWDTYMNGNIETDSLNETSHGLHQISRLPR